MMPNSDRIFRSFGWVVGGRLLGAALQAVLLVLVARWTGPATFGLLSAVLGIATASVAWLDLGLSTHIVRERSVSPRGGHVTRAVMLSRTQAIVLCALGLATLSVFALTTDGELWLLMPIVVWAVCERQADVLTSIKLADGKPAYGSTNLVARRALALAIFGGLTLLGLEPVLAFTLSIALASVMSLLGAMVATRGDLADADDTLYRSILKSSRYYWLNSAASQSRMLDSAIVAAFAGATAAGAYSVASRLTTPLRMLPTAMATAALPVASRIVAEGRPLRTLVRPAAFSVAASTGIALILGALSPAALPLLLGSQYDNAVAPTIVVIASLPVAAVVSFLSSTLQGANRPRPVGVAAAVSVAFGLIAAGVGAALWGAVGAAAAFFLSITFQALLLLVALSRLLRDQRQNETGDS